VVICLERGADLHMVQLMPLPLTVSCFSNIQIGFTFLVPAHLGSPGKGPLNGCVCMTSSYLLTVENPLSAELEGEVGCYNLLVRAVETAADVDIGDRSWLYVAQQLRSVDSINGSLMQMILTHRSALRSELVVTRKSYRFAELNQSDSHR